MVFSEPGLSPGQVTLYPNPAHSMVYVSFHAASTDPYGSIILYDLRGQLILTKQVEKKTTGIDVSGLKPGVYFVRFGNDRETRVLNENKNSPPEKSNGKMQNGKTVLPFCHLTILHLSS
jgi:hypothetical protein